MNYLNELASAKRQVVVDGQKLYITTDGRIRKQLEKGEESIYMVEKKDDVQYVFEKGKQIQPKPEPGSKPKPNKKGVSKLQGSSDASAN